MSVLLAPGSTARAQGGAAEDLGAPLEVVAPRPGGEASARPPDEPDEFADIEAEVPPREAPPPEAPPPWAPSASEPERELYWRMPRSFARRPLTLPQGVMRISGPASFVTVPGGAGGRLRFSAFLRLGVGIMDDWEIGATPLDWTFLSNFHDPTVYTRARLLSGEVQVALRGELALPVTDGSSAWMALAAELAWTPAEWFRFETALDYGLHFVSPLQQTIYVPLRATFQVGPNGITLSSGAVMYNDADDFDVPILLRFAHATRGGQGPRMDMSVEGGVADATNAENSWLVRFDWIFYAYL